MTRIRTVGNRCKVARFCVCPRSLLVNFSVPNSTRNETSLFQILDADDRVALTDVDNKVENLVSDAVSQCDESAVSIYVGWIRWV